MTKRMTGTRARASKPAPKQVEDDLRREEPSSTSGIKQRAD